MKGNTLTTPQCFNMQQFEVWRVFRFPNVPHFSTTFEDTKYRLTFDRVWHRGIVPHLCRSPTGLPPFTNTLHVFLETIMNDAVEDHVGTWSIGERTFTNLRFDDCQWNTGNEELSSLVNQLNRASIDIGMEISAKETKITADKCGCLASDISVHGQKLQIFRSEHQWPRIKIGSIRKNSADHDYTLQSETLTEGQKCLYAVYDRTLACTSISCLPLRTRDMDAHNRTPKKDSGTGNEMLPHHPGHILPEPHQRPDTQFHPAPHWTLRRPSNNSEGKSWDDTDTWRDRMAWLRQFPRENRGGRKEERETEEEMERQYEGMDWEKNCRRPEYWRATAIDGVQLITSAPQQLKLEIWAKEEEIPADIMQLLESRKI